MKETYDMPHEIRMLQREMDQVFNLFFTRSRGTKALPHKGKFVEEIKEPATDIYETEKNVIARIELPGIEKDQVDLHIMNNSIEIKAHKKSEEAIKQKSVYRHERTWKSFYRVLPLPAEVDPSQAKAKMDKGVLEVRIPKSTRINKRNIEIE